MNQSHCPCGSKKQYNSCCQKFHNGDSCLTTVDLLRARFSAFIKHEKNFLVNTHHPFYVTPQLISNLEDTSFVPSNLKIIKVNQGLASDTEGCITYSFDYLTENGKESYQTTSLYSKIGDQWFYVKDT